MTQLDPKVIRAAIIEAVEEEVVVEEGDGRYMLSKALIKENI